MNEKTKTRLTLVGWIIIGSTLFAMGYGPIIGRIQGFETPPPVILQFGLHGILFGLMFGWFEVFYAQGAGAEWFRRQPFIITLSVKTFFTSLIVVAVLFLGGLILNPERLAEDNAVEFFIVDVVVASGLALIIQLVLAVRTFVGGRVLTNLVLGRYHHPLEEERIFLFLDMAGSTALAEGLGDIEAQAMITRFFFDVAQATIAWGGETHRYIGDEVVVTWPLDRGTRDAACLQCSFAIDDRIAERADDYLKRWGVVPTWRIGLHGGPVVAAECGDDKQEIVYFGDTVNTAARIEQYCRKVKRPLLISGDLLQKTNLPDNWTTELFEKVELHGRASEMDLYAVSRS